MKSKPFEIENLLDLPDEVLLARLFDPGTSTLEWVAVSAVIDQRKRARSAAAESTAE